MECKRKIIHTIAEGDTLYKLSKQYDTTVTALIMGNPAANPYNLRVGAKLQVCPGEKYFASQEEQETPAEKENTLEEFLWSMRRAWLSQIYWVRMYLMSVAAETADKAETEERMYETVDEIMDVFAKYLPVQAVRRVRELLMKQTELIAAGIQAEKEGKTFDYSAADDNAVAMAKFFADLNPYFEQQVTENQLLNYLDLTRRESMEYLAGEFGESINTFRDLENETGRMADYFARGLLAR